MRLSKLVGERLKDASSGTNVKSHNYLLRAGYLKQVCNGIFTMLTPAQLINLKIQIRHCNNTDEFKLQTNFKITKSSDFSELFSYPLIEFGQHV